MNGEASPHHVLIQLVHIPGELAAVHGVSVYLGVQAVPLRGGEFFHSDGAKGDALQSPQIAGGVRGQFLCHRLPTFLVAHLVHGPCKAGIALGRAAGLGVLFLQLEGQGARLVFHAE